jgi:hypothetical protein
MWHARDVALYQEGINLEVEMLCVEGLDSLMGCDLGNISAKAVKNL